MKRTQKKMRIVLAIPWIDSKTEHKVEVIDDASNGRDAKNKDDEAPKDPPTLALGQAQVVETMCWGPQIEA